MCEPTTIMMGVTLAIGLASTAMQAQAKSRAADRNAKIAQQNAVLADRRARDAVERGQVEEESKKREGTALRKSQEASFSAANIDTSFGSPLDFIISSATEMDLDAAIIRTNAEREGEDFTLQARQFRDQSALAKHEKKAAIVEGVFTGLGQVASAGASFANAGGFSSSGPKLGSSSALKIRA